MSTNKDSKGILLEVGTNEVEFLLLNMGKQRYGINVSKVCQIMVYDPAKVAALPRQQSELIGVMTFRGRSISVVDLRDHLKVTPLKSENGLELLVVTEFNQRTTAFIIDTVDRIERCSWEQFEPITSTVCNKSFGSVVGTVTLKDGIVIILDLETIMAKIDPEMSIDHFKDQIAKATVDRSKVSIVYCEDSPIVQKILIKSLEEAGFKNLHTFNTGQEGLEYLQNTPPDQIDIILSDIEMPKMDGLTLCKSTRKLEGYEKVPFVFFSSMINEQMQSKCMAVGGNACFSKPEIHLMVPELENLLNAAREGK